MEKIGDRETIKKTEKLIAEYYGPIDTKKGLIKAIITYIIAFTVFFAALSMLFMDNKNVLVSKEVRDKKGKVVKEAVYTSRLEQLEYQARITSPNNTWNLPTKIGYAMYYMANSKEYKLSIQISFVLGLIIIPLAYIFRGLSAAISASYLVLGLILFGQMITRLDVIIFGEGIAAIIAWLFWRKQMKAKRLKTRAA